MNNKDFAKLIYKLRTQNNLTQKQLAEKLNITDKTVSKWECANGYPDISLLMKLSTIFNINVESLLTSTLDEKEKGTLSMKKINFYVCPECKNVITAFLDTDIYCCNKKLEKQIAIKDESDIIKLENIDNEYYLSSNHIMQKDDYISFIAIVNIDTIILRKFYPQWNLQTYLPRMKHSVLYWYSTKDGLFYKYI